MMPKSAWRAGSADILSASSKPSLTIRLLPRSLSPAERKLTICATSNAAFDLLAQRSVNSILWRASSCVASPGAHSSKAIAISAFSAACTSIEISGERKQSDPSMCDRNSVPASVILRSAPRLQTWNPPESVSMARFQPMKLCRPPHALIVSIPGRNQR